MMPISLLPFISDWVPYALIGAVFVMFAVCSMLDGWRER